MTVALPPGVKVHPSLLLTSPPSASSPISSKTALLSAPSASLISAPTPTALAHALLASPLPPVPDTPLLWPAATQALLSGSPVFARLPSLITSLRADAADAPLETFLAATAVVRAHGVALEAGGHALSPGAAVFAFDIDGNAAVIEGGGGLFSKAKLEVCATTAIAKGDIIALEGDVSGAAQFLLDYGEAQGEAVIEVGFEVGGLDPFYDDKVDILEVNEEVQRPLFLMQGVDGRGLWRAPEHMEAFVRLLCLGGGDAFLLEAVFRRDVYGFMEAPVSPTNEAAMCEAIIAACEDLLDGYTGVFPEEEVEGVEGERIEKARLIVDGEKEVLRAAVAYYQKEIDSLDTKEYYQERRLKALDLLRPIDESEIVDADAGRRMSQAFDDNY